MNRRKGTPCACESDPCGCSSPRNQCVKTINGQYPDANHEFNINSGEGVSIDPDGNGIRIGIRLASPMVFRGTVGTGGTIATLPSAVSDNLGWTYIAISSGSTPDTPPKSYDVGDMLISNGVEWSVVPSGDDPVDWSQIQNKPTTVSGYGITDAVTGTDNIGTDTKPIKVVNGVATAVTNDLMSTIGDQKLDGHLALFRNLVIPNITTSTLIRAIRFNGLDSNNTEATFSELQYRVYGNRTRFRITVLSKSNTSEGSTLMMDVYDTTLRTVLFIETTKGGVTTSTTISDVTP